MSDNRQHKRSLLQAGKLSCGLSDGRADLSGRLTIAEAGVFSTSLMRHLAVQKQAQLEINLDALDYIDSAGVIALFHVSKQLQHTGVRVAITGGSDSIMKKLELFRPDTLPQADTPITPGFYDRLGGKVRNFIKEYVFEYVILAANIFYWSVSDVFKKKTRREGEFLNQTIHIGVNAVLIIVFLSFIIGFVMALQSADHLRAFGANLFVVDLVMIAVTSQLGPLIAGIMVAGRSGAAIAAEIGTMKVTSELDALKTMGLDPVRFVVIPKLYACLFTMPVLVLMSDVAGVLGGAFASYQYLGITPEVFLNRAEEIMTNKNLITGFVKSQVYASIIVLTGSFFGFKVIRGAEGVGKMTTTAVVVAITLVMLADSILMVIFY